MQSLGQVKAVKARFVERKTMAILSAPLELSGTLSYVAPGRLEKHTLRPKRESLILDGNRLTIEDGEKRRTLMLQQYPTVWAFVESIRSTLAGDLQSLKRFYQVRLQGVQGKWLLLLDPSDPAMQEVVSEVRIAGRGHRIDSIEILEAGGDRSVMTITEVTP